MQTQEGRGGLLLSSYDEPEINYGDKKRGTQICVIVCDSPNSFRQASNEFKTIDLTERSDAFDLLTRNSLVAGQRSRNQSPHSLKLRVPKVFAINGKLS